MPVTGMQQKVRAWRAHLQGLDGRLEGRPAGEVLEQTGWARSVGGVGPYLTLFSRAGISRETADAAVAVLDIHELPSARGCTYVVPASDFALALKAGEGFTAGDMKVAYKLGVSYTTVMRWMAGRNEPTRGAAQRLAELFDVDYREFYGEQAA